MNGPNNIQGSNKENVRNAIIILGVVIVLAIAGAIAFYGISVEPEREFSFERAGLVFVPGEIKILLPDVAHPLTFNKVHLEGRIVGEPIVDSQSTGVLVSFQTIAGDTLQVNILLGENDREILTFTADEGASGETEEWRIRRVAEIVPLLSENDPIQIRLNIHEISDESFQKIMDYPSCEKNIGLCSAYLEEIRTWYVNNSLLIDAIQNNLPLPENHTVGAVSGLVLFDDYE